MTTTPDRPIQQALTAADAGEVLTLQRAAYVTEAQLHDDLTLPPLTQTFAELRTELGDPTITAIGLRDPDTRRLVAAVRVRQVSLTVAELGRLAVAPDVQGMGLGTRLLLAAETVVRPGTLEMVLFTGDRSLANLRLYARHGYEETRRSPAGGHQLVHLTKRLAPMPPGDERTDTVR